MEPQRSRVLDPRSRAEAEARVAAAKAALSGAQENVTAASADAEYATSEFDRLKKLFDLQVVSQDSMEQARAEDRRARANLKSSEFAVEVARHQLEAARTALKYSAAEKTEDNARVSIRAPISGHVLKIYQKSEGICYRGPALPFHR